MSRVQIFPTILIVLDVAAAVLYAFDGNVRRAVYWIAAAIITAAVTF